MLYGEWIILIAAPLAEKYFEIFRRA